MGTGTFFLNSPIEQFILLPIFNICSGISNLSIFYVIICIILLHFYLYTTSIKIKNVTINISLFLYNSVIQTISLNYTNFKFIPTANQFIFENLILEFTNSFKSLVNSKNIFLFFYSVLSAILFILFSNLIGLIPYTFTITAQIFITINLSLLLFITFNILGFLKYGINLIQLIIPSGVHLVLHFLLVPIELISYIFKPISLSIRLFANIMAGHTLLKVICGFIYQSFNMEMFILFNIIPFLIISILFGLECFVALIQSYVFFILLSLFLKDIINLSH
jgi:F-type H+-transporting ATPase subunit a